MKVKITAIERVIHSRTVEVTEEELNSLKETLSFGIIVASDLGLSNATAIDGDVDSGDVNLYLIDSDGRSEPIYWE